ncbi:MAG: hypothetical protein IJ626_02800 [Muribaculaceae bacterium]|nr:hypothetical protein [Muribaculaceae bacterium]
MSIRVTFPDPKAVRASKGTAGLQSQVGGAATTVSVLMGSGIVGKEIG